MTWFSDEMIGDKGLDLGCISKIAATGGFSHDNLSHILLGMLDIKTNVYDAEKDILINALNRKYVWILKRRSFVRYFI